MNKEIRNDYATQFIDTVSREMEINYANKYRTVILSDEVDRNSIFKCMYWLDKIVENDKKLGTKEDITIRINSFGGVCYMGLGLISRIQELQEEGYKIIGIVDGVAMSMGSAILNVCSIRKARRYSTILIHQVNGGAYGELRRMEDEVNEAKRLWSLLKSMYLEYTNITEEKLNEVYEKKIDWFISPKEALELKIVDEII